MSSRAVEQYRLVDVIDRAKFDGRCAIVDSHRIARREKIGRCVLRDNPLKDLIGFACHICVADLQDM